MKNATFPIIVQKELAGGYTVINPLLAGCYSEGDTLEEALANIKEATEMCLEELAATDTPISFENTSIHTGRYPKIKTPFLSPVMIPQTAL